MYNLSKHKTHVSQDLLSMSIQGLMLKFVCLTNENREKWWHLAKNLKYCTNFHFPWILLSCHDFVNGPGHKNQYILHTTGTYHMYAILPVYLRMKQTWECFSSSSRSRQFSSRRRIFRRLLFPLFHMLRATRYRRRPSGTVKGLPWSSWASASEVRSYSFTMSSSTPTTVINDVMIMIYIKFKSFDPLTYDCYIKCVDQRILF